MGDVMDAPAADASAPTGAAPLTLDRCLRWVVAAFSATTAAIHFGFAPAHLSEDWAHGLFFLLTGWLAVVFAILVVVRPRRWVWAGGLLLNLGIFVTWAVSRSSGLPFGPTALRHEAIGTPDLLCAVLEGAIVVIAAAELLFGPALARRTLEREFFWGLTALPVVAAVVVGSIAMTPAYAGEHTHSDAAGGHDHTATGTLTGTTPCELSGPPSSEGQAATDAEGHSHRGPALQENLTKDERVTLEAQQAQARTVADRYPTVKDAEAAGYRQSVTFVPCIGAHYTNISLVAKFDPGAPSELLYDGTAPDSKIVGLSYLVFHPGGPPEGFAGPNDRWHQHNVNGGLCFGKSGGVIGAESMSADECASIGGAKRELTDIWMVHDWIVPGWECTWGAFAGECPELGGKVGGTAWDAPDPQTGQAIANGG
ncbi:MAG: hypothetical protein ACXWA3_14250 [Acidimicrobiales bacterium]